MKVKELIEYLEKHNIQDFNLRFRFNDDKTASGYELRDFDVEPLDIGYSDKVVYLTGDQL